MATLTLHSLTELQHALNMHGRQIEEEMVKGMQRAARFGATAALRTSTQTTPRPKASGTYERSWLPTKLSDGAVLSNTARHAIFVERGRRPGRQPPLEPIMEWLFQKRIVRRFTGKSERRGAARKWRARFIARSIARKIGRKGTRGRFILRKTMPIIAKRVAYETRKAIRLVTSKPRR